MKVKQLFALSTFVATIAVLLPAFATSFESTVKFEEECSTRTFPLDIVWVLDESGSVGKRVYEIVKRFVKKVHARIKNEDERTRVGLVEFAGNRRVSQSSQYDGTFVSFEKHFKRLDLDERNEVRDFSRFVNSLKFNGGSTNTMGIVDALGTYYFADAKNEKRENSYRIVIFLTDGRPNPDKGSVLSVSNSMVQSGSVDRFMYVTVGNRIDEDLFNDVDGYNKDRDYFRLRRFKDLDKFANSLVESVTTCDFPPPPCGCDTVKLNAYCHPKSTLGVLEALPMLVTETKKGVTTQWTVDGTAEFTLETIVYPGKTAYEFECKGENFVAVADFCGVLYPTSYKTTSAGGPFRFQVDRRKSDMYEAFSYSPLASYNSLADVSPYQEALSEWVWGTSETTETLVFKYSVGPIETCAPTMFPTANPTTSSPTVSPTVSPTDSPTVSPTKAPTTFADCSGANLLIAIDQSLSIGDQDESRQKAVIDELVDLLPIGPNNVGVSVTNFGMEYIDAIPVAQVGATEFGANSTHVSEVLEEFLTGTSAPMRFTNFEPLFDESHGVALAQSSQRPTILLLSDGEPFTVKFRGGRRSTRIAINTAMTFKETHPETKLICFQSDMKSRSKVFFKNVCDAVWLAAGYRQDNPPGVVALEMMQNHICRPTTRQSDPCEQVMNDATLVGKNRRQTRRNQRVACLEVERNSRGVMNDESSSLETPLRKQCYWTGTRCKVFARYAPLYDTYVPPDAQ